LECSKNTDDYDIDSKNINGIQSDKPWFQTKSAGKVNNINNLKVENDIWDKS